MFVNEWTGFDNLTGLSHSENLILGLTFPFQQRLLPGVSSAKINLTVPLRKTDKAPSYLINSSVILTGPCSIASCSSLLSNVGEQS